MSFTSKCWASRVWWWLFCFLYEFQTQTDRVHMVAYNAELRSNPDLRICLQGLKLTLLGTRDKRGMMRHRAICVGLGFREISSNLLVFTAASLDKFQGLIPPRLWAQACLIERC